MLVSSIFVNSTSLMSETSLSKLSGMASFIFYRQWFIGLLSIGMIGYFTYCLVQLHKTQRRLTFDFLMILIETLKVSFNLN